MTHSDLRQKYLDFFEKRGHKILPSASLVPENDPTTLFTGSGMQPMIPYLLGAKHPLGNKIVDAQLCFRGQDIEEVGDNRHSSFFEMLGNWSLGDYFKKDQLTWIFELLVDQIGLDPRKLYVTVFIGDKNYNVEKDNESIEIWQSLFKKHGIDAKVVDLDTEENAAEVGMQGGRIFAYGVKKNWWARNGCVPKTMPAGEPGGPDSEMFFDFGIEHDQTYGKHCHPNCDCGRFMEIGNSVFMQYQKAEDGSLVELPQKNVDFGGGLERVLAAVSGNPDMFTTDLYTPIINKLEKISGKKYDSNLGKNFRVIADHIKAAVFVIADGVIPSNKDRGYILRRLIRRSVRFGRYLGIENSFITPTIDSVIEIYGKTYKHLVEKRQLIVDVLSLEENKFQKTIANGLKEFEKISKKNEITTKEAFYLYESFGFPYELIEEESKNKKISFPTIEDFNKELNDHKEQSRTASKGMFKGGLADHSEIITKYHTATHLLQKALRTVLGEHVHQEGSNITAERLRFDFAHPQKMTPEEIEKVQKIVNEQIANGLEQKLETMTYEQAISQGALAFFKERYPEKVTVYSFGDFSKEICGGPHVQNTNVLGKFEIIKEESVSSGVRRIYAKLT